MQIRILAMELSKTKSNDIDIKFAKIEEMLDQQKTPDYKDQVFDFWKECGRLPRMACDKRDTVYTQQEVRLGRWIKTIRKQKTKVAKNHESWFSNHEFLAKYWQALNQRCRGAAEKWQRRKEAKVQKTADKERDKACNKKRGRASDKQEKAKRTRKEAGGQGRGNQGVNGGSPNKAG